MDKGAFQTLFLWDLESEFGISTTSSDSARKIVGNQKKSILKSEKSEVPLTLIVKSWKPHPEFFLKFSFD